MARPSRLDLFTVVFSMPLVWCLPPHASLNFYASYFTFNRISSRSFRPTRDPKMG